MFKKHVKTKEELHVVWVKDCKGTRVKHIPNLPKTTGNESEQANQINQPAELSE